MEMDYESLLKRAYSKMKVVSKGAERFEIPKIEGHIEGKKTILTNFSQIVSYLRRNPEHFLKSKEKDAVYKQER